MVMQLSFVQVSIFQFPPISNFARGMPVVNYVDPVIAAKKKPATGAGLSEMRLICKNLFGNVIFPAASAEANQAKSCQQHCVGPWLGNCTGKFHPDHKVIIISITSVAVVKP